MYGLGIKALRKLCAEQNPLAWQKAKLSSALFKPYEQPVFEWVQNHLKVTHALPQTVTLEAQFPDILQYETPEPSVYYVKLLENQYFYETINKANLEAQAVLKNNQDDHEKALGILRGCINAITAQKYRMRILDVGKEAKELVLSTYNAAQMQQEVEQAVFGWPYMDTQTGGLMPGDVVSFVGRPAAGKTWLTLYTALKNWRRKKNVLFVSMEMMVLPVAQRITTLYAHQNIQQLKTASYSGATYKKFCAGLKGLELEEGKFYVIDGNLAASVEDIFVLADMLQCDTIIIDGAYLLKHRNPKLDRFQRAADNVELIKRYGTDQDSLVIASWQFNRVASEKQKKSKGEQQGDLEDIGYTDAIGQISSIALGLFQEDGIETMVQRKIRVLKGRNGETGQFSINWDFDIMNFDQCIPPVEGGEKVEDKELQWV